MSSSQETLRLHDPRLDTDSNKALNWAEELRATFPFKPAPTRINGRLLTLALLELPDLTKLADTHQVDRHLLETWAYTEHPLSLFGFDNPNPDRPWDPHVELAIANAHQTAKRIYSLPTVPPVILVSTLVESEPMEELFFLRSQSREGFKKLSDDALKSLDVPLEKAG